MVFPSSTATRWMTNGILLGLFVFWNSVATTSSFVVTHHHHHHHSTASVARLSSSKSNLSDDEISKLIGKRNQIKRKKKDDEDEDLIPMENLSTLDLDKMPEFKTKRPVRQVKKKKDDDKKDKKDSKEDELFTDFAADYDDENEWHIPNRIGFSTIGWGDPKRGFVVPKDGKKLTQRMQKAGRYVAGDIQMAYNQLLDGGICLIETSAKHGSASAKSKLSAHDILSRCMEEHNGDGGAPTPLLLESLGSSLVLPRSSSMKQAVETSCGRLDVSAIEAIQAGKQIPMMGGMLAGALHATLESGSCNYVGSEGIVSAGALKRLAKKLEKKGSLLVSNSFEFSLTNTKHLKMIQACKSLGIIPLISNPLDDGLSSGIYTATNPSGGGELSNAKFTFQQLDKIQPLHSVQETVVERVKTRVSREMRDLKDRYIGKYGPPPQINTDITTTQVAINYVVAKGGVPLPEINTPSQAEELLGCLGWSLNDEEIGMLDSAIALCKL